MSTHSPAHSNEITSYSESRRPVKAPKRSIWTHVHAVFTPFPYIAVAKENQHMAISVAELDGMQAQYKAAVEEWVGAIREEEALASTPITRRRSTTSKAPAFGRGPCISRPKMRKAPMRALFERSSLTSRFNARSNAHRHQDIAVTYILIVVLWPHLAGGLRVLELHAHFAGFSDGLEKIDEVA